MNKPYRLLGTFLGMYVIAVISLFLANGGSLPLTTRFLISSIVGAAVGTALSLLLNRPRKV